MDLQVIADRTSVIKTCSFLFALPHIQQVPPFMHLSYFCLLVTLRSLPLTNQGFLYPLGVSGRDAMAAGTGISGCLILTIGIGYHSLSAISMPNADGGMKQKTLDSRCFYWSRNSVTRQSDTQLYRDWGAKGGYNFTAFRTPYAPGGFCAGRRERASFLR